MDFASALAEALRSDARQSAEFRQGHRAVVLAAADQLERQASEIGRYRAAILMLRRKADLHGARLVLRAIDQWLAEERARTRWDYEGERR